MILKFILGIILGWFVASIGIIALTTIRVGIPLCNTLLSTGEEDENALKLLKKRYYITLLIWIPIIVLITLLCYIFLGNGFYAYLTILVLMLLIGFSSSGNTESNMQDFYHSLKTQETILMSKKIESDKKYQENINRIIDQLCSKKVPISDNGIKIQEIMSNSEKVNNILEGKENIDVNIFINSKNPYTNKEIKNYDDILEYLNMYKLDLNNIDPLSYEKNKIQGG